jgi:hypothetical protein
MHEPLRYRSGEEILRGDRILFHGNVARIEFVAVDPNDPENAWFVQEYGGGVMILEPSVSGSTFLPAGHLGNDEDLVFVARNILETSQ